MASAHTLIEDQHQQALTAQKIITAVQDRGYYIHKDTTNAPTPDRPTGMASFTYVLTGRMNIENGSVVLDDKQDPWVAELDYRYEHSAADKWQWSLLNRVEMMRKRKPNQTDDAATLLLYVYFVPSKLPDSGTVCLIQRHGLVYLISKSTDDKILELGYDEREWFEYEARSTDTHWVRDGVFYITRSHKDHCHNLLGSLAFATEKMERVGDIRVESPPECKSDAPYWPGKKPFIERLAMVQMCLGIVEMEFGGKPMIMSDDVIWPSDMAQRQPSKEFFEFIMKFDTWKRSKHYCDFSATGENQYAVAQLS